MLDSLGRALARLGIPATGDELLGANITWSHNISFLLETRARGSVFLKAAPDGVPGLEREWAALTRAGSQCPANIPVPIGLVEADGWRFLATAYRPGRVLTSLEELWRAPDDRRAIESMLYKLASTFRREGGPAIREPLLGKLVAFDPCLAGYLQGSACKVVLEGLNCGLQHGDLVRSNIVIDDESNAIAFDWEDFGVVDLPGFDVALLFGSLLDHDAQAMVAWFSRADNAGLIERVTPESGLQLHTFLQLLPIYYGAFALLKHENHYRESIQKTVLQTVADLVGIVSAADR